MLKLSLLGWTQDEISKQMSLDQRAISKIMKNFNVKEIHNSFKSGKSVEDLARKTAKKS